MPAPLADLDGLDWHAFSARYHPGAGRHDLEGLVAYAAYRSNAARAAAAASALLLGDVERGALAAAPV
jgi:hypothetical protein